MKKIMLLSILCVFFSIFHLFLIAQESKNTQNMTMDNGAIVRTDTKYKRINLVFTAHDFGDGGEVIQRTLKKHKIKGSFFFTGDFYRNYKYKNIIAKLKKDGHYLGAHSDKHLLYCDWEKRDSLLVTKQEFTKDLLAVYAEMKMFGVKKSEAPYFLPPYEWYNEKIAKWTKELKLTLINFTPGTSSNADYTTPDMGKRYISSDTIFQRILRYEKKDKNGLNGFIMLIHFGTDEKRTDKFYNKLDDLITQLKQLGYEFVSLKETIN
jgi:endoglucanase